MSALRVELVHGGRGSPLAEPILEARLFRELVGSQELQQPEESVRVVLEGRRAQEEDVATKGGDGRHRAPAGLAGMPGTPAEPLGFVHDQEVDARGHRLLREPGPGDERLERNHRPAVDVEGIEVGAEVAGHVAEPLLVEEGEDLVVLAPQLAEPLHGQGVRSHHQAPLDAPGANQAIQDQAGLDGLAHADLVGEQPAHRVLARGALGDVKLVGVEPDASAQEGAEARGLTKLEEAQGRQPVGEVGRAVDLAAGQPLEEATFEVDRPQVGARELAAVDEPHAAVGKGFGHHRLVAGRRHPHAPAGSEVHRHERRRVAGQPELRSVLRELDRDRPRLDRDHAAESQLGVEAVGEVVSLLPHETTISQDSLHDVPFAHPEMALDRHSAHVYT